MNRPSTTAAARAMNTVAGEEPSGFRLFMCAYTAQGQKNNVTTNWHGRYLVVNAHIFSYVIRAHEISSLCALQWVRLRRSSRRALYYVNRKNRPGRNNAVRSSSPMNSCAHCRLHRGSVLATSAVTEQEIYRHNVTRRSPAVEYYTYILKAINTAAAALVHSKPIIYGGEAGEQPSVLEFFSFGPPPQFPPPKLHYVGHYSHRTAAHCVRTTRIDRDQKRRQRRIYKSSRRDY